MYKNFAIIACVFGFLSIFSFMFFNVKDNKKFDKVVNKEIKELVNQFIKVQYRTHSEETLDNILTKELLQNLDDYYPNYFRKELLYYIDNNYMRSLRYYEEKNEWYVSVNVYEGLFKNSLRVVFGFTQKEDGNYIISSIAIDI